jgi:hypothetical protein
VQGAHFALEADGVSDDVLPSVFAQACQKFVGAAGKKRTHADTLPATHHDALDEYSEAHASASDALEAMKALLREMGMASSTDDDFDAEFHANVPPAGAGCASATTTLETTGLASCSTSASSAVRTLSVESHPTSASTPGFFRAVSAQSDVSMMVCAPDADRSEVPLVVPAVLVSSDKSAPTIVFSASHDAVATVPAASTAAAVPADVVNTNASVLLAPPSATASETASATAGATAGAADSDLHDLELCEIFDFD